MGSIGMTDNTAADFVEEFLGSYALVYIILHTVTTKSKAGNSYYGLAIGFTVVVMAYALGGFETGACFNLAIALGLLFSWGTAGIAIAVNILCGVLAAILFKIAYTSVDSDD